MAILLLGQLPMQPKLAKSSRAERLQRLITAKTLRGIFELIFAYLNSVVRDCAPMDCANSKIRKYMPILSGWIRDHIAKVRLHEIISNPCPKC